MGRSLVLPALAGLVLGTTACGGPKPVSEADAANIADETQTAWASRNVPAIESRYAKTVVGFDPYDPDLSTTWEKWDHLQKGFAGHQLDTISVPDRRIQVLDDDTFIVSGVGSMKNASDPKSQVKFRFTDVYKRQDGSGFVIVNEHVSVLPTTRAEG